MLVDTVPPTLELDLQRGTAGDIVVQWKTSDPNLKVETLQLSYQGVDGGANWQSIDAGNSQPGPDGKWTGNTSFVPSGALPPIYVRAEVADAAGNQARTQSQLQPRAGDPATNPNSLPSTTSPRPLAQTLEQRRDNPWQAASPGTPIQSPNYPSSGPSSGSAMHESRPFGGSSAGRISDPPSMARSFPGREQIPPGLDPGINGAISNGGMSNGGYSNSGSFAGPDPITDPSTPEALPGLETIPPGRTNRNSPASAPSNIGGAPQTKTYGGGGGETIGPGDAEVLPTPTPTPFPNRREAGGGSIVDGGVAGSGPSFGSPAGTGYEYQVFAIFSFGDDLMHICSQHFRADNCQMDSRN